MKKKIYFYSAADDFGEFSNFADYPIKLDSKKWRTVEHYFQAMKFNSKSDQEEIRIANSPLLAARKGRDRKRKLRKDWESVKVSVMQKAAEAKFTQHPELTELLMSTGDAIIVEHTENDNYWGDGGDGKGRNMLGKILIEIREKIRRKVI